jgi:hypothetical protein
LYGLGDRKAFALKVRSLNRPAEVVRLLLSSCEQRPVVFHVSANTKRLGDVLDFRNVFETDV